MIRADRLKARMHEMGLDQSELAEKVGVTQGTISLILRGKTRNSRRLPKIALVLDVDMSWLMGDEAATNAPVLKLTEDAIGSLEHDQRRVISVQAVLPSEAALTEMFRALLGLVPPDASRDKTASILAQLLPAGFQAIGPDVAGQPLERPLEPRDIRQADQRSRRATLS